MHVVGRPPRRAAERGPARPAAHLVLLRCSRAVLAAAPSLSVETRQRLARASSASPQRWTPGRPEAGALREIERTSGTRRRTAGRRSVAPSRVRHALQLGGAGAAWRQSPRRRCRSRTSATMPACESGESPRRDRRGGRHGVHRQRHLRRSLVHPSPLPVGSRGRRPVRHRNAPPRRPRDGGAALRPWCAFHTPCPAARRRALHRAVPANTIPPHADPAGDRWPAGFATAPLSRVEAGIFRSICRITTLPPVLDRKYLSLDPAPPATGSSARRWLDRKSAGAGWFAAGNKRS